MERLVDAISANKGDGSALAAAVIAFMNGIGKGFSRSAFGDRFAKEVRNGCVAKARGKAATIQSFARFLVAEPDQRGVGKVLARIAELKRDDGDFASIELDHRREFWEAVKLCAFDDLDAGLTEITNRRTHGHPRPPHAAISTVHKAKGLECDSVILMPCDARSFPDRPDSRCLLYVALSRAKKNLLLVVSGDAPSPLLEV